MARASSVKGTPIASPRIRDDLGVEPEFVVSAVIGEKVAKLEVVEDAVGAVAVEAFVRLK